MSKQALPERLECCQANHVLSQTNHQLQVSDINRSDTNLIGYVDADWARDTADWKSTSGYIYRHGGNAISWSSMKQTSVTLLSTEAEHVAAAAASQGVIWLNQLLHDLGKATMGST